jgi:hypothetical protein
LSDAASGFFESYRDGFGKSYQIHPTKNSFRFS